MKHPDREEWIPFVFGEVDSENRKQLAEHLAVCPECSREIAGWRRTLVRLDAWPVPEVRPRTVTPFPLMLKWALAAMLVLGLGFLAGRASGGAKINAAALSAQVEASVRSSLELEMRQAVERLEARHSMEFAAAESRRSNDHAVEAQRIWRNVVELLGNARAEDARTVQALVQQLQDRHEAQYVALRKDLETLALMTDEEIRQARMTLVQLADNRKTID